MPSIDYEEWNRRLLTHFFGRAARHRTVRLKIDAGVLKKLGGSKQELVDAVLAKAVAEGASDAQALALAQLSDWRRVVEGKSEEGGPIPQPPFLPFAAILVLAVNHGGGKYKSHNYSDRLHDLLGHPSHRIKSIKRSVAIWRALTEWSTQILGGRQGVFDCAIVGRQEYVGIPRRQVLLAPREVDDLRRGLLREGILPGAKVSDFGLLMAARRNGELLSRTRKLLREWPSENARELLGEIRAEFDRWDHVEGIGPSGGEAIEIPVRVCLQYTRGKIAGALYETDVIEGVTDGDRQLLAVRSDGPPVRLEPLGQAVSRLCAEDDSDPWNPSMLEEITFLVQDTGVRVSRRAKDTLVFGKGSRPGLLEEMPEAEVEPGLKYLLVSKYPESKAPGYVGRFLDEWSPLEVEPALFRRAFVGAESVERSLGTRLELAGGLITSMGSRAYLPFALPAIRLVGISAFDCRISVQYFDGIGRPIGPTDFLEVESAGAEGPETTAGVLESLSGWVKLPASPTGAVACRLRAVVGDQEVAEKSLFLDPEPEADFEPAFPRRDGHGLIAVGHDGVFHGRTIHCEAPVLVADGIGKPWRFDVPAATDDPGLDVMHLLRCRPRSSWSTLRQLLQAHWPGTDDVPMDKARIAHEVSILHALGILEIEEAESVGWSRVHALAPGAVVLSPKANLGVSGGAGVRTGMVAFLTGCWLKGELHRLEREGQRSGVTLGELPVDPKLGLVPKGRFLVIEGERGLARVQRALSAVGARVFGGPGSFARHYAVAVESIERLTETAGWTRGGVTAAFETRFFDPRTLSLCDELPTDDRFVMMECQQDERRGWWFFLVDRKENRRLQLRDRQLGRWFVRTKALPDVPVPVCADELLLPMELRLPRVIERMAALSGGRAPMLRRYNPSSSPLRNALVGRRFGLPEPPERQVAWFRSTTSCSGAFICYPGFYRSSSWPARSRMPMIGAKGELLSSAGMED